MSRSATSSILRPYRVRLAAFGALSFLMGLVEATFLVVITRSLITVTDTDTALDLPVLGDLDLSQAALVATVLVVARLALGLVVVRLQTGLTYRVNSALRRELGHEFLTSDWATQSGQQRGMLQHLVVQFPANITSLVHQTSSAFAGALSLVSLLVIALLIDVLATVVVIVALVILGSILLPMRRAVRARTRAAVEHQTAFNTAVAEVADMSLEISALGVASPAADHLDTLIENEMQAHRRVGLVAQSIPSVYTSLAYGAIVLAILALDAWAGDDLSGTAAVMLIMLRSLTYGQQIQQGATALQQLAPVAEKLETYRDQFRRGHREPGTRTLESVDRIQFDDVTFAYDGHEPVLHNVEVIIARGEVIGVVGSSGAGKTTFVQLLLGLLRPTNGRIRADGTAVRDISPESWHRLATYVPQETRLLDGTLADNVRFLRDGISDEAITTALSLANLTLDSDRFPDGIHTDLGAAGRQFSGGQRQRLAIARALATNPSILVLDEPTSSLDSASEEVVVETIARLKGLVTTIVVSHRDSTLSTCDRVLRIENGSVSDVTPR
jgi:ATP-binding cassette subfamily B protein